MPGLTVTHISSCTAEIPSWPAPQASPSPPVQTPVRATGLRSAGESSEGTRNPVSLRDVFPNRTSPPPSLEGEGISSQALIMRHAAAAFPRRRVLGPGPLQLVEGRAAHGEMNARHRQPFYHRVSSSSGSQNGLTALGGRRAGPPAPGPPADGAAVTLGRPAPHRGSGERRHG